MNACGHAHYIQITLHHCTIVIVLYLALAHSNSIIDNDVI